MVKQQALFDASPPPWQMDDQDHWLVARVVFSQKPFGPYDYAVPNSLREQIRTGQRVNVPLGRGNRSIEGYCVGLIRSDEQDTPSINLARLKPINRIVDANPLISLKLLELAHWISDRWHCPLGITLETILPVAVRDNSNTRSAVYLESDPDALARIEELRLPPKQRKALEILSESRDSLTPYELAKATGCTVAPISALRKKNLVQESTVRVEQKSHELAGQPRRADLVLNAEQSRALAVIESAQISGEHQSILLHGITGSGKTEVYIRAIQKVIEFGRQSIVLVPEISLTPQTQQRFCERFDHVAVLHSNQTAAQRAWHWRQIAAGKTQVVIGARSAIFAPVPHLGLIVLDEEHDGSFKQDQAPRYHTRDVARFRAMQQNIPLVLGSATPSLESWHAAQSGQCKLVTLPKRILDLPLPDVTTVDLRGQFSSRQGRGAISRQLYAEMKQSLDHGGQIILLLNRRGYATTIQCPQCGYVMYCPDCAIAMTHHRDRQFIMCHYCDHREAEPRHCQKCGFANIQFWGVGTQRLEQEVQARFPEHPCIRMDTDSMQRSGSHERALAQFRSGEKKILLGTQMIAKGLDFPNVTLVGVINADTALHLLDFRASERTFTLVTQVAGRTGRGPRGGHVLVQTLNPEHPAILAAQRHDYAEFANLEMQHRNDFGYPPFGYLARFIIRSEMEPAARNMADELAVIAADWPNQSENCKLIGPAEAPISKLRGKFRFHFLLRSDNETEMHDWIEFINARAQGSDNVQYIVDVDPQDML